MKYLGSLILLLIMVSCNEASKPVVKEITIKQDTLVIAKADIEAIKYVDYVLDSKAKSTLASWQTYTDVMTTVEDFKSANFSFFVDNEEIFITTLEELETTIPEKIDTEPIKARLLVLKTKLFKLKQQLKLSNTPKNEKLKALKEVFEANANVTLQINKKYEKEAQKIIKPY